MKPGIHTRILPIAFALLAIVGTVDMPVILDIVDLIEEQVDGAVRVEIPNVAHQVNLEAPDSVSLFP